MDSIAPPWVKLTSEQKEARRLEAARDLATGMTQSDVARKYGVKPPTVHNWKKALDAAGLDGLRSIPKSGRPHKLTRKQGDDLVRLLLAGARKPGHQGWNSARVQVLIRDHFGIEFSRNHVPRLLRGLGFRPRTPDREAIEKDHMRKALWLASTWEQVKKN